MQENDIINFRSDLFTLSPPSLNHSLSFIASQVALVLDDVEYSSTQLYRSSYRCGLYRLIDESSISLIIQPGILLMIYMYMHVCICSSYVHVYFKIIVVKLGCY